METKGNEIAGMNEPIAGAAPARLPRASRWLLLGVCVLAYCWLFPWSERTNNPNENVRIYMVRSIVEHGTFAIGERAMVGGRRVDSGPILADWGWVNDKALACADPSQAPPDCSGKLYPGKAPGTSLFGVPFYAAQLWAWRLSGQGTPSRGATVWWLRFWCVVLPTLVAWSWLAGHLTAATGRPRIALAATLAAALGSLSLTYGQMFAGHQPSGLALLLLFAAIVRAGAAPSRGAIAVAGLAAGAAVCIEFPAAPAAILLVAWLVLRRRRLADLTWLAIGGAAPVALLAAFNWSAFGTPWELPYAHLENPGFVRDIAPGFFGISLPDADKLYGSLISPFTGLWFWAPWCALAFMGLIGLRGRAQAAAGDHDGQRGAAANGPGSPAKAASLVDPERWLTPRAEGVVAAVIVLYFLVFQTSHSLWRGGWVVGPRYITPLVPFAAIACAHGIAQLGARWRSATEALFAVLAVAAIATTGSASAVSQGFPMDLYNPLAEAVGPLLAHGWVFANPAMAAGVPGPWSALPYFVALLAGALWIVGLMSNGDDGEPTTGLLVRSRPATAIAIAAASAAAVVLLWHAGAAPGAKSDRAIAFMTSVWTPPAPPGATPISARPKRP